MPKTLPLRFRILHFASTTPTFSVETLLTALRAEYAGEGQFTRKMLAHHCDSLRAVGMIAEEQVTFAPDGTLAIVYAMTDYGRTRLSYLPDDWK